jgi:hypothetical protein
MPVTDPRVVAEAVLGLAWQTAEDVAVGAPPYIPPQFIVARDIKFEPDPAYIHPDGTHGAIFHRKDGTRIVANSWKIDFKVLGSRHQVLPFLESVLSGQPTVATADLTETGDTEAKLSLHTLSGVRPYHNASGFVVSPPDTPKVFLKVTATVFPVTIEAYKDVGLTILVAGPTVVGGAGPYTLAPAAGSNLTVTGSISAAPTVSPYTVTLTIGTIAYAFANQFARYFRLYYTDSDETQVYSDCVVSEMEFASSENGELEVSVKVMARRRLVDAADNLTAALDRLKLDLITFSHHEVTITKDPSGSPVVPAFDSATFKITNNVLQYVANSANPQKLIKRGWVDLGGSVQGESCDETAGLVADARLNVLPGAGFKALKIEYLISPVFIRFEMANVRFMEKEPGVSSELIDKVNLDYDALDDGSATAPLVAKVKVA